jgi:hypothetical protein
MQLTALLGMLTNATDCTYQHAWRLRLRVTCRCIVDCRRKSMCAKFKSFSSRRLELYRHPSATRYVVCLCVCVRARVVCVCVCVSCMCVLELHCLSARSHLYSTTMHAHALGLVSLMRDTLSVASVSCHGFGGSVACGDRATTVCKLRRRTRRDKMFFVRVLHTCAHACTLATWGEVE